MKKRTVILVAVSALLLSIPLLAVRFARNAMREQHKPDLAPVGERFVEIRDYKTRLASMSIAELKENLFDGQPYFLEEVPSHINYERSDLDKLMRNRGVRRLWAELEAADAEVRTLHIRGLFEQALAELQTMWEAVIRSREDPKAPKYAGSRNAYYPLWTSLFLAVEFDVTDVFPAGMKRLDDVAEHLEKRWCNLKDSELWKTITRERFPGDPLFLANLYYLWDKKHPEQGKLSYWDSEGKKHFTVGADKFYTWDSPIDRSKEVTVFKTVSVLSWRELTYSNLATLHPQVLRKIKEHRERP